MHEITGVGVGGEAAADRGWRAVGRALIAVVGLVLLLALAHELGA